MIIAQVIHKIKSVKKILISVWFLGLIIAVPVILFMPSLFNKYKAVLVLQESAAQAADYRIYFRDMDGNGIKQKIYAFRNNAGQLACQYFRDNGGIVEQIDFNYNFSTNIPYLYFEDVNENGRLEIYGFTLSKDSLFLNWAELTRPYSHKTSCLFLTRIGIFEKVKFDFSISRFMVGDLDDDGNNEIVIAIVTGQSKFPRMLMVLHPETGRIVRSEDEGINPLYVVFYDLNQDQKIEIIVGSNASYNLTDSTRNQVANRPYLLAYDSELKKIWSPIAFSTGMDNILQIAVNGPNLKEILVFQYNRSQATEKMVEIYKVGFNGKLKDSTYLPEFGKRFKFQIFPLNNNYWLYTGDKMVRIDNQLRANRVRNIETSAQMYRNVSLAEGNPEVATTDLNSRIACIYSEEFKHKVVKNYVGEEIRNIILGTGMGTDHIMVQTNSNEYTYHFQKNWLYYFRYVVYLFIYLLSVLFVWLIQHIRERQLKARFEIQTQLRNMEVRYLRMQMDPHFMFNAFNSMALLLKNGAREEAFDAFMKFTQMVRSNFDFSDRFTRPLNEELQMVRHFLDINKLRFKEKLDFQINLAEDVPMNMLIPKMMLQIHVENALKHGLAKSEKSGILRIDILREKDVIRVIIEDNGIGRQKSAQGNGESTRQGLKMLEAMYDRLNQQNKVNIVQFYTDLTDNDGNPAGTRVEMHIPLNLKVNQGDGLT
jgi:hypothetical protein